MPTYYELLGQARHVHGRSVLEQLERHGALLASTHGPWHNSGHVNLKSFIFAAAIAKLRRMRGVRGEDLRTQASDVTESVCAELYLAPPTPELDLVAWVFRTITHEIEPSGGHCRGVHVESIEALKAHGHDLIAPGTHQQEQQPEVAEATDRLHDVLRHIVEQMPKSERSVATVKLFEAPDAKYPEIAKHLGITVEAARQRWSRARKRLQLGLEDFDLRPLVHVKRVARVD